MPVYKKCSINKQCEKWETCGYGVCQLNDVVCKRDKDCRKNQKCMHTMETISFEDNVHRNDPGEHVGKKSFKICVRHDRGKNHY